MVRAKEINAIQQPTVIIRIDQNSKSSSYLGSLLGGVQSIAALPIHAAEWTLKTAANAISSTAGKTLEISGKIVNAAIEPVVSVVAFSAKATVVATIGTAAYLAGTDPKKAYEATTDFITNSAVKTRDKAYTYFAREVIVTEEGWFTDSKTTTNPSPFEKDIQYFKKNTVPELKVKFSYLFEMAKNATSYAYRKTALGANQALEHATGPGTSYNSAKEYATASISNGYTAASDFYNRAATKLIEGYSVAQNTTINVVKSFGPSLNDLRGVVSSQIQRVYDEASCRSEDLAAGISNAYSATATAVSNLATAIQDTAQDVQIKTINFGASAATNAENIYTAMKNAPSDFVSFAGTKMNNGYTAAADAVKNTTQAAGEYLVAETGYKILNREISNGDVALGLAAVASATLIAVKYLRPAFANRSEEQKK